MSEGGVPPIGERIRAERVRRGVTVRGLARDVGVSASLISQIETDKSQPSVSTLYAITTALGISIGDLFDGDRPAARAVAQVATADGDEAHREAFRALAAGRQRHVGPVTRPPARELLTLDSGVVWERLGQLPGAPDDFLLITYSPGGASSSSGLLMRHTGSEYGYVTAGELVLTLGFDEHRLRAGDAVCFDSTTPHAYRNERDEPAVGVWFVVGRPG